jgi:hypothetical protein
MVPGHGARLLKVTPLGEIEHPPTGVSYEAEAATLTGSAAPAPCPACSGGVKVGNIGGASQVIFNSISVHKSGIYRMQIDAMTQGPRTLEYSVNGAAAASLNMGGGSYLLPQSSTVPVALHAGNNTITFLNPSGYGADLDRIVISGDGKDPAPTFTTYEAEGAQLAGTAGFDYSTRASGGAYVGNFGAGPANTITFNNVSAAATGTYQLEIDYVTDGPRTVYVSINGATPLQLTFNGNNWYDPVPYVLPVQLLGGVNTIVFSNPNPTGYAPGIDVIIVSTGANTAPRIASDSTHCRRTAMLSDTTPGAILYYTTDGAMPTQDSTVYTGPILVPKGATLRAIALAPGYPPSDVAVAAFPTTDDDISSTCE